MTWEIFVGIGVLVSFMIAIISPILKLNSSITELNCTMKTLNENMEKNEKRITKHGEAIDDLVIRVGICENDINNMREKINYFHDV